MYGPSPTSNFWGDRLAGPPKSPPMPISYRSLKLMHLQTIPRGSVSIEVQNEGTSSHPDRTFWTWFPIVKLRLGVNGNPASGPHDSWGHGNFFLPLPPPSRRAWLQAFSCSELSGWSARTMLDSKVILVNTVSRGSRTWDDQKRIIWRGAEPGWPAVH